MTSLFIYLSAVLSGPAGGRPVFPADIAPPVPALLGIGAVALVVIGLVIVAIVVLSLWVLRRIKQDSAPEQDD
jgi:hypothetical protein